MIVGADGLYSQIARLVGAASVLEGQHAGGVLYSYWQQFAMEGFYWRFRPGIGMGVIPTNDDACCIFVAVPSQRFRREIGGDATSASTSAPTGAAPLVTGRAGSPSAVASAAPASRSGVPLRERDPAEVRPPSTMAAVMGAAYVDGASPLNYLTPTVRELYALDPGHQKRLEQMRLVL